MRNLIGLPNQKDVVPVMTEKEAKSISKFLSLVLRHQPETIGITLDDAGWTDVDALLNALQQHGREVSREELEYVVATNSKKRFAFDEYGGRIRAQQGHSIQTVDLNYEPAEPPPVLFHGTTVKVIDSILCEGLRPMKRQHVHLSADVETAISVGQRHGKPIVLEVDAAAMYSAGKVFYLTPNGVWLTHNVAATYLRRRD